MTLSSVSRTSWLAVAVVAVLVVSAGSPVYAVDGPREERGSAGQSADRLGSSAAVLGDPTAREQANPALERAAREGAEAAVRELQRQDVALDTARRTAAVDAAVAATNSVGGLSLSNLSSGENGSPSVSDPDVSPDAVRVAARGAVYGGLVHAEGSSLSADDVSYAVMGAVLGAVSGRTDALGQGGQMPLAHVRAGAQGAAEGTAQRVIALTPSQAPSPIGTSTVLTASSGGATGAVFAAGMLPIYGERATPDQVYNAALGSAAGTVQGTHTEADEALPRSANESLTVAVGSSAGVVLSLLHTSQITPDAMRETAYDVAVDALTDPQVFTTDQLLEATFVIATERFASPSAADSLFPEPVYITGDTVLPIVFSPRDPDGNGLYEDVNGNGVLLYSDVVALSAITNSAVRTEFSEAQNRSLDFNGDCVFDNRDVWALDDRITGGAYADEPEPPISGINDSAGNC